MKNYFYINSDGQQNGPISTEQLKNQEINKDTLVWSEGMSQWMKAGEVADLEFLFIPTPPSVHPVPPTPPSIQPISPVSPTPQPASASQCPENYMVFSILTTILCCLPAGIAAIIYSSKVDKAWAQGNKDEAKKNSEQAKLWCIISLAVGIIVFVISFIAGFLGSL